MTLNDLNESWNELRNAALGRGVKPLVSEALAAEVADSHDRWKSWLSDQGVITASADAVATSVVASQWIDRWRALAARVQAEGVKVPAMPATALETVKSTAGDIGTTVLAILGVAVVAAAAAWAFGAGRGSR